MNGWY